MLKDKLAGIEDGKCLIFATKDLIFTKRLYVTQRRNQKGNYIERKSEALWNEQ